MVKVSDQTNDVVETRLRISDSLLGTSSPVP